MASTVFIDQTTVIVAAWLNDVNSVIYNILGNGTIIPATIADARTNLGLGSLATQDSSNVTITGGTASGLTLSGAAIPVSSMGTGISTTTPYSPIFSGTTATGPFQASLGPGTAGQVLTSGGAGVLPSWGTSAAGSSIQGAFKNLAASATGLSALVTVTVDEIAVESTTNTYQTLRAVSVTPSLAASGANGLDTGSSAINTWYSVWIIWNGTTTAGLLSTSATAPTMPATYTHKARVGWVRSDSTANKYPLSFVQAGRSAQYKVAAGTNVTNMPQLASGSVGNVATPTWVAISLTTFVPTTAMSVRGTAINAGTYMVAPNASYGAFNSTTNPPLVSVSSGSGVFYFEMVLESTSIYWASNTAGNAVFILGWMDNL